MRPRKIRVWKLRPQNVDEGRLNRAEFGQLLSSPDSTMKRYQVTAPNPRNSDGLRQHFEVLVFEVSVFEVLGISFLHYLLLLVSQSIRCTRVFYFPLQSKISPFVCKYVVRISKYTWIQTRLHRFNENKHISTSTFISQQKLCTAIIDIKIIKK